MKQARTKKSVQRLRHYASLPAAPKRTQVSRALLPSWTVWAIAFAMVIISVSTLTRMSVPWSDEAMYSDPAFRLVEGKGFTSTQWFAQSKTQVFAGYPPLYSLALAGWLSLTNPSLASVRLFGILLICLSVGLIVSACRRLKITTSAEADIALIALLFGGYGMLFSYRTGRPDPLHILVAAQAFHAFSWKKSWFRSAALVVCGALLPLAGMQAAVFAVSMGLVCLIKRSFRLTYLTRFVPLGAGTLIGALGALFFYHQLGLLDAFLNSTVFRFSVIGRRDPFFSHFLINYGGLKDLSLCGLWIFSLVGIAVWRRNRKIKNLLTTILWVSACTALVPCLVGKWPVHYSWMAYIPMAVGCSALISRFGRSRMKLAAALTAWGVLPFIILNVMAFAQSAIREPQEFGPGLLHKNEAVLSDPQWFYAVHAQGAEPVSEMMYLPLMSEAEKRSIQVVVVESFKDTSHVEQFLGGRWDKIATVGPPTERQSRFNSVLLSGYRNTNIFRRR